jgi:hypothetical protein
MVNNFKLRSCFGAMFGRVKDRFEAVLRPVSRPNFASISWSGASDGNDTARFVLLKIQKILLVGAERAKRVTRATLQRAGLQKYKNCVL